MPSSRPSAGPAAWFDGLLADRLAGTSDDVAVLDRGGWWAVLLTFEGAARLWRFDRVRRRPLPPGGAPWRGPDRDAWRSSLPREEFEAGVREIRRRIREGDVYQVNLCRLLSAEHGAPTDPWALAGVLARGNPAPFAGVLEVPTVGGVEGIRLVSASPELFLARGEGGVTSSPIKGTAVAPSGLRPKDEAENVMIVDLVRNDLQRVCLPGSVEVPALLRVERHPGLAHLVSDVAGTLAPGTSWPELLGATMPPGSVSGAPKSSALSTIRDLEPTPRGPYCGAVGWVDADRGVARLAVAIRTFWWHDGALHFGTGAGITWGSDPGAEWRETELKAERLIGLASTDQGGDLQGRHGLQLAGTASRAPKEDV